MTDPSRSTQRHKRWFAAAGITIATLALAASAVMILLSAPDPEAAARLTDQAERMAAAGRLEVAAARLAEAKRADPGSARPYLLNAQLLERSAHDREAVQELHSAHAIAPRDPRVTLALLRELPPSYPPAAREDLARQAVTQAPQSGEAHYLLGQAIVAGNDADRFPQALREYEAASRRLSDSAVPLTDMGRLCSRMGDDRRAAEALELAGRLLDRQPVHGPVPIPTFEEWLRQRRAAAFWLAQVTRRLGREAESHAAQAEAARMSETASELRRLKDRARSVPPDRAALARLAVVARRGLDAWDR